MRGFPQMLSTKQDYMNCLQLYPEQTKTELRRLLADRYTWEKVGELQAEKDGKTDSNHRVISQEITDEKTGNKTAVFIQLEKKEDKNAPLYRIGFTVKEIELLI